jgi:hypothetical protein
VRLTRKSSWNLQVHIQADYVTSNGESRTFHSADFVDILVPLTVTESSIFGEDWYDACYVCDKCPMYRS